MGSEEESITRVIIDTIGKRTIKFVFWAVIFVFFALTIITGWRIVTDKPVKLWGAEWNQKKDSAVRKTQIGTGTDTFINSKSNSTSRSNLNLPKSALVRKGKILEKTIVTGKNNNTGTNNGAIGDNSHNINGINLGINGDIKTYIATKQRYLDDATFNYVLKRFGVATFNRTNS